MAKQESSLLTASLLTALSPALISLMVGSLIFFIAEVLYAGRYSERLLWTLFCFVGGVVLVSRIAIVVDRTRAAFYGLVLAGVTYVALMAFIQFPANSPAAPIRGVINLVLILIVWWTANTLTWDCTFLDDRREVSGQGLLAAAGLEADPIVQEQRDLGRLANEEEKKQKPKGFAARYKAWKRERDQRPHTPGTTVVWFALAALPIFGLGQSLIPATEESRRRFTFYCAAIYVSSALSLLMTISYVGLRRYLQQRKVAMPNAMTATWLGFGACMIVIMVVLATILPRPYSETPIVRLDKVTNPERQSSKNAIRRGEETGEGQGKAGEKSTKGDGNASSKSGDKKQSSSSSDSKSGNSKEAKSKESGPNSKADSQAKQSGSKDVDSKKQEGKAAENKQAEADNKDNQESAQAKQETEQKQETSANNRDSFQEFQQSSLGNIVQKLGMILKWIVFAIILLAVLFLLFRGALTSLASHFSWAYRWLEAINRWLANLFRRGDAATTTSFLEETEEAESHEPFRSFLNPFAGNGGEQRPIPELIRYSYRALEAWAADAEDPRQQHETVLEFAARISVRYPALAQDGQKLAQLVTRLAYAPNKLPSATRSTLEQFWDRITQLQPGQGQLQRANPRPS